MPVLQLGRFPVVASAASVSASDFSGMVVRCTGAAPWGSTSQRSPEHADLGLGTESLTLCRVLALVGKGTGDSLTIGLMPLWGLKRAERASLCMS